MINLLPEHIQEANKKEYTKRIGITFGVFFYVLGVLVNIARIPTLVLFSIEERNLEEQFVAIKETSKKSKEVELNEVVRTTNNKILKFKEIAEREPNLELIKKITGARPEDVSINQIEIDRATETMGIKIRVGGEALHRDDLVEFNAKLDAEPLFVEVTLPISHLAKEEEVKFTISAMTAGEEAAAPKQ